MNLNIRKESPSALEKVERYRKSLIKVSNADTISLSLGVKYPCVYCKIEFCCEGGIFVHLTTLKHLGPPDAKYQANPRYECNVCGSDVALAQISRHPCVEKAYRNYWNIVRHVDECGCPNMCLLCRGMLFQTPAHLNIHIILVHSWKELKDGDENKKSSRLVCPFCFSIFRTNDVTVLHLHAFEEHVSSFMIPYLISFSGFRRMKYGSETDMKQWLKRQTFSCNFPHSLVKRYPITKCSNINRSLPEFNSPNCGQLFSTLISLTSHLCSHHFLDINNPVNNRRGSHFAPSSIRENDVRISTIEKELHLKNRNLLEKNLEAKKVIASKYCLECFKIYRSNFDLQIHYLVAHCTFNWNICGICDFDCKTSLALSPDTTSKPERTNSLLWNALSAHERSHLRFFKELKENPKMEITKNLLPDFPCKLKKVLAPYTMPTHGIQQDPIILNKSRKATSLFTIEEMSHLSFLGKENRKVQTELIVLETLTERGR